MTLWNHQRMKRRDWERVPDCNRQLVFIKNALAGQIAERAAFNSEIEGFAYLSKISVVSVPFHGIAAIAQGLKIIQVVRSTQVARDNVVHFQGPNICRNAA